MPKKKVAKKESKVLNWNVWNKRKAFGLVLLGVSLPITILLLWEIWLLNHSLANLYLGDVHVGNLTREEIRVEVEPILERNKNETLRIVDGETELIEITNIGSFYSYDLPATVEKIMSHGKSGNYWEQLRSRFFALRDTYRVAPVYGFDRDGFDLFFAEKLAPFEQKVQNARYEIENGNVKVVSEADGVVAKREMVLAEIDHYLALTSSNKIFEVEFELAKPQVTAVLLEEVRGEIQNLIAGPIELTSTELFGQTFKLSPEEIYDFTRTELVDGQVVIQVDEYKVAEKTKHIAEIVNKEPLDAFFSYDGARVAEFQPAVDGTELDTKYLADEIKRVGTTDTKVKTIDLPLKRTAPAITTESVNEYGIREVVGTGKSLFTGSAPGRVHNVALASKKLNGVLIAPDEVFSMYAAVGDIEKETGFQDAFVIKNGRTIPGIGGGVCQVSTTLFRAALNAGLPIVERRPHAYRVSYYEKDSPPGLDAAIYFPSADLKFKNDTGNYLLLQTKVDTKKMTAEFNLYGVRDGRVVEISKPVLTGQMPPPPDLYVDDPNLERGKTVKDEYAAWGATVTFSRKVSRNGELVQDDVFKSSYRPWQAVFRVGTKDI